MRIAHLIVASLMCGVAISPMPEALATDAIPDFGHSDTGWFPVGDDFLPPVSGPGPVVSDPAHPYYSNQSGRQPTDRVADLNNPILQPWVRERLRRSNEATLSGKVPFSPRETCHFAGVPDYDVFSRLRPVYFLQTPKEVTIINEGDQQVRRVFMNVPHSKNPKPSWYGESVGRYEDGALVIDTIGMNDKTFVDNVRTPHTTQLHVVERYTVSDDGRSMDAIATVDDPGAYTMQWSAMQRYRRVTQPYSESVCAENNNNYNYFNLRVDPIPEAAKADF